MPTIAAPTPRAITRRRRKESFLRIWNQYRRSAMGIIGLGMLIFFVLIAIFGPLLVGHCVTPGTALISPLCHPSNPALQPPSSQFWLGTDSQGRSVLSLTILGTRISLIVGLAATIITVVIGAGIGLVAGYYGGRTEVILMRLTDWFLVIPFLPLAIVLSIILKPSLSTVIFVIGVTSWPSTARVIRAQVLTVKTRTYVERARALGAGDGHMMTRHILPNVGPLIFANTILIVAVAILSEAVLSFLSLGPDPINNVSWGTILETAFGQGAAFSGYWWWIVSPGTAIVLLVLAFTMIGYALDDILNPKLRSR